MKDTQWISDISAIFAELSNHQIWSAIQMWSLLKQSVLFCDVGFQFEFRYAFWLVNHNFYHQRTAMIILMFPVWIENLELSEPLLYQVCGCLYRFCRSFWYSESTCGRIIIGLSSHKAHENPWSMSKCWPIRLITTQILRSLWWSFSCSLTHWKKGCTNIITS